MSSAKEDWCTPPKIVEVLNKIGPIGLDPCSNSGSIIPSKYSFTLPSDGLKVDWAYYAADGFTFVNPPYGSKQKDWVTKAVEEAAKGAFVVMLVPARPDTKMWHNQILGRASVCLVRGRITFIGAANGAPFPTALIAFSNNPDELRRFELACTGLGTVICVTSPTPEDIYEP